MAMPTLQRLLFSEAHLFAIPVHMIAQSMRLVNTIMRIIEIIPIITRKG